MISMALVEWSLAFAGTLPAAALTMLLCCHRSVVFGDGLKAILTSLLSFYVRNGNDRQKSVDKMKNIIHEKM